MAYNHGVKVSEKPTSILPPVSVSAGIPFIVGTAPVNMSDVSNVNRPVLCSSYAEAVAAFGFVPPVAIDASGLKKYEYSISQFIYSHFALFGASPVIIVNALDPTMHKKAALVSAVTLDADGSAVIPETGIIPSSLALGSGGGGDPTKAQGSFKDLSVEAVDSGEFGNSLYVSIFKYQQSGSWVVSVGVFDGPYTPGEEGGGQNIASGNLLNVDSVDVSAQDLNGILGGYKAAPSVFITFSGSISMSDIPEAEGSEDALWIHLEGGSGSSKAYGQSDELTVKAVESGENGNKLRVEFYEGSALHSADVRVLIDEETVISGTVVGDEYGNVQADALNAISGISEYVVFYGEVYVDGAHQEDAPVVEIELSGGSEGSGGSGATYTEGVDYVTAFDDDGYLVINAIKNGGTYRIPVGQAIAATAQKLNPAAVDASDIIGGVDVSGNKSGFELVDECFPRFRLVPGLLLAPGYSGNAALAAVMAAKAANINQEFTAIALIDVPTESVGKYSDVAAWKNTNSITDPRQIVCWPGVALDGVYYDLSVQLAGAIAITDSENDDVPYVSPSNHAINATASVLASGEEVWIAPDTGAYLNGQGVVTALNFIGGWVAWGNRTACYPANTDVKDSFIPVKRMFAWVGNTIIQTYWSKVDAPLNRRLIDTVLDSVNLWLNGLAARQYIIGGRVEFNPDENPSPDLLDGIVRFHVYITLASPARELDFLLEYSPEYLANLFA